MAANQQLEAQVTQVTGERDQLQAPLDKAEEDLTTAAEIRKQLMRAGWRSHAGGLNTTTVS
ncbi:hypothetical protein [Streptomyces sp. Y1]|uniref:Uncharacterized protein n=1 Tax=Streptomyces sp. Y1 TaxID=3238634 RepID=A0AB39TUX5_9ACTN